MNTYFLYARKSSESADKQVLSIESQLHELREFAKRESLTILEEITEERSALSPPLGGLTNATVVATGLYPCRPKAEFVQPESGCPRQTRLPSGEGDGWFRRGSSVTLASRPVASLASSEVRRALCRVV